MCFWIISCFALIQHFQVVSQIHHWCFWLLSWFFTSSPLSCLLDWSVVFLIWCLAWAFSLFSCSHFVCPLLSCREHLLFCSAWTALVAASIHYWQFIDFAGGVSVYVHHVVISVHAFKDVCMYVRKNSLQFIFFNLTLEQQQQQQQPPKKQTTPTKFMACSE